MDPAVKRLAAADLMRFASTSFKWGAHIFSSATCDLSSASQRRSIMSLGTKIRTLRFSPADVNTHATKAATVVLPSPTSSANSTPLRATSPQHPPSRAKMSSTVRNWRAVLASARRRSVDWLAATYLAGFAKNRHCVAEKLFSLAIGVMRIKSSAAGAQPVPRRPVAPLCPRLAGFYGAVPRVTNAHHAASPPG